MVSRLEEGGRYPRWVLVTAVVGMFATSFPITILAVSLRDIAEDLGSSETTLAWVISAPLLASAVALPILGKLGDLYGHRRVFLIGFALAAAVAGVTSLAWNAASLIGFRTLAQVLGAATQPASIALIMGVYPPEERVKAMGWWSLVAAGAPSVGLVVGGPLIEAFGWRPIFVLQAVFAAVAVGVASLVLNESEREDEVRFDVTGALALAVGVGAIMFVLDQGVDQGVGSPLVVICLAAGPLALGAFVAVEHRAEAPLLPLGFFRRRNFSAPLVVSFFAGAAYMGGFILAPFLLRGLFGWSLSSVALAMVLRPLAYSIVSPLGGQVATRIGERATITAGTLALATAMGLLALSAASGTISFAFAGLVVQGMGNGLSRPSLTASLGNAVDEADLGIATASARMVFQMGSALGITLLTVLYGGDATGPSLTRAYLVGLGLAAVAAAVSPVIRSTPHGDGTDQPTDGPAGDDASDDAEERAPAPAS